MTDFRSPARLVFEDGTAFEGWSCGTPREASGVVEFKTDVVGYQEIITDPKYSSKILVMTMPQIGNYGVNSEDSTSDEVPITGLIVREMCYEPSNYRSEKSLPQFLEERGIATLDGVDTRAVTLYLRDNPGSTGRIELMEKEAI
ncbi:MAG: hypothetical protein FWE87_03120 [Coriobacteriia bacterium]|nr:hypothetical protein [Coriobacteriia bacterium]